MDDIGEGRAIGEGYATLRSDVSLRDYRRDDLDALYALDVACFESPFRFTRAMIRQSAEAKNAHVVVAESEGELLGFAILQVESLDRGLVGYLVTLDVAEPARRRGVARTMVAELERRALDAGCEEAMLHVFTGNAGAIGFYEQLGYVRTGVARGFYARGCDAWVYGKRLGG